MRFLRQSLTGIFLFSLSLALLVWAGNTVRLAVQDRLNAEPQAFTPRERVMSVNVLTVAPATIAPEMTVFGEVQSRRTLSLRSPVGGTVLETAGNFVEGGQVRAGDLLLRLDPVEAEAALARVEADLSDAEAELRDAERGLDLAQAEIDAADEQAALRDAALARARDLADRGVGSTAATETAELALSAARASVLSRQQALAQAEARRDQATTRLARAEIARDEAGRVVDETTIRAAFDGTLTGVGALTGGRVSANEELARLVDPAALEVAFRVSTAQFARLIGADGQVMQVPLTAALEVAEVNLLASGRIARESAVVGEGQSGRQIFATLESAPGFRPGDFVTLRITEPALDDVALIPATAVAADRTVLVVGEEERLSVQSVTVLRSQGDAVIVDADGIAGAVIVAERSPLLGVGIRVNPITPGTAPAATAAPEMLTLDADRRAKLIAYVTDSPMPADAKARILSQLEQDEVPAETVTRLESRMGS